MSSPANLPAEIISHKPQVQFVTKEVAPPSPLYIGPDDRLGLATFGLVTVTLNVRARILLPATGEIITMEQSTPQTSFSRAQTFHTFPLTEGFLLSCTVAAGGNFVHGFLFTEVGLFRGPSYGTGSFLTLARGHVTQKQPISWPNGDVRTTLDHPGAPNSIQGTDPAAGVEISETVPAGARWQILAFSATLVTDATVVNRHPVLIIDDGVNVMIASPAAAAQVASTTRRYTWAAFGVYNTALTTEHPLQLPPNTILTNGWRIRTATTNLQAGDNWGMPIYLVKEWFEGNI